MSTVSICQTNCFDSSLLNSFVIPGLFKTMHLISKILYKIITRYFRWWPIDLFIFRNKKRAYKEKRIAYFLWHYPVLSQTFIQREITGLLRLGLPVQVIAEASEDILDNEKKAEFENMTYYLLPMDNIFLKRYKKLFLKENPFRFYNLFLYGLFHNYGLSGDYDLNSYYVKNKHLFSEVIYLAGILREKEITHVHSPWANRCAYISLMASRLAGTTYSVQARAHDIHRKAYSYGFGEKLGKAEFIITNTEFNRSYLKSRLGARAAKKIHVINNGVPLYQLDPGERDYRINGDVRILSVARLIEPKGLEYLLKACRILKEQGIKFRCEIIGGPEEPMYTADRVLLMKLHKELSLENEVFFLGVLPFKDVLSKYKDADIFVLPCVIAKDGSKDITPNSLIEAMAMKLPVISTTITAIPEIVENGVSGVLVSPNDAEAVAAEVTRLIQNITLRKKYGENARKRVEEKFDIEKNIHFFKRLFFRT